MMRMEPCRINKVNAKSAICEKTGVHRENHSKDKPPVFRRVFRRTIVMK
jgi:hypothetical protein